MESIKIRPIQIADNAAVARLIRSVLLEYDVPKVGTAYADPSLENLYAYYQQDRARYWVVEKEGAVIGAGGIAPLENYNGPVCELQKMYFLPEARGLGLGRQLIGQCLEAAREFQYEACYLETMTHMETAQALYRSFGFDYLDGPMGDTGHFSCGVQMLKRLTN